MLRYGYLESASGPCVLLWGDHDDLRNLASLLRGAHSSRAKTSLADLGCHAQREETVWLAPMEESARGMRTVEGASKTYVWTFDRHHAATFADLLDALARCDQGHQYLETGSGGEIIVKASIGEYPDDFLTD